MAKKILIMDTILRDAHQSQAATRMRTEQMIPVLEQLDEVGYYSLEGWGGATFDSCMRYLNEDPWERLRTLRKYLKKTPIQMLLRGQNLLGYRNYADDIVEKVVEKSFENGVRVVRVFDALNDPRNIESSMKAINKYGKSYGGVCEAAISYTTSPVHTLEYFVKLAKTYEGMGADNICIKDMANLLLPFEAYRLVSALRKELRPETKIHLHTHNTTGTG
ncbi:MAG: oxaloacetate decarboxylase subunit alpha, partial [Candidatus Gallimonas sp.]